MVHDISAIPGMFHVIITINPVQFLRTDPELERVELDDSLARASCHLPPLYTAEVLRRLPPEQRHCLSGLPRS